ncbi:hypothetical protein ACVBE9_02890 [Eionea flava]
MTTKDHTFNNKQNSLLTELESIKTLLDSDDRKIDNIPLLQTPISQHNHHPEEHTALSAGANNSRRDTRTTHNDIAVKSTTMHGVLPGQQSLFNTADKSIIPDNLDTTKHPEESIQKSADLHQQVRKTRTTLADNPFLPAHVRQRLQAASSNNEQAATEPQPLATVDASYSQQLVDQLVAHHLPKIEAELRQKLLDVIQQHNQHVEK